MEQPSPHSVVAVDLGSNSFHLLEATLDTQGNLKPLTALARKVQLALDMDAQRINPAAMRRGLECLDEFASYCRDLPPERVRVVGTQALRRASNRDEFVREAQQRLNHGVDVISGEEEAHLAYYGVAADPHSAEDLLVIDIGGGSTELTVGSGRDIQRAASLPLGCVSWLRFFPGGELNGPAYTAARQAALDTLAPVRSTFTGTTTGTTWSATGCSGTLLAVGEVLRQNGWGCGEINLDGLEQLQEALLQFRHIEQVRFQGLLEQRRNIFASGLAIVSALFEALELETMALSGFGLREGIAWSLLHRGH